MNVPGAGLFEYITFRAGLAMISALFISFVFGKRLIRFIKRKQIGETVRDLGLEGQQSKNGTPTMGGLIIIFSILVPVLLFSKLHNIYIILLIMTTLWLGFLGFLDDYIKVFKKNKAGLKGKFKVIAQFGLGLIIALIIVFNPKITTSTVSREYNEELSTEEYTKVETKSLETTIPFFKNNRFDYGNIFNNDDYSWANTLIYIVIIILIVIFVSNGVNLTDGLDGLAAGTSSSSAVVLAIFAYVSGNIMLANYLNIMYIPNIGELVIFTAALVGATIGFLWYNTYPAQIFMGDTGSLTIGGIIAVLSILTRKEWLLPIFGGIFFIENISVMLQVSYFKYTKKRFGAGKRLFLMSPLHHHYQKKGIPEAKIVTRFIIISIILTVISVITLKIR